MVGFERMRCIAGGYRMYSHHPAVAAAVGSHHQQQHGSHPHSQHPDALLSMGLAMSCNGSPAALPSSSSSSSSVFHSADALGGAGGLTGSGGSVLNGGDGSSMSSPTSMASMSSAFGLSSAIHGHPHHPHGHPAASLHGLPVPVGLSMGIHGPLSSLQAEKRKQRRIRTTFTSSQLKVTDVSVWLLRFRRSLTQLTQLTQSEAHWTMTAEMRPTGPSRHVVSTDTPPSPLDMIS